MESSARRRLESVPPRVSPDDAPSSTEQARRLSKVPPHQEGRGLTTEQVLATISWDEDVRDRASPRHFTELLHDAVPVLRWTGWHCTETGEGFARTVLPLNYESTNQHGTHQAALMVLALDYTGGIALSSAAFRSSAFILSGDITRHCPTTARPSGS